MYLSNNSIHKLDNLIKDFEVAYRSYTVDIVKQKYPTEASLENHLRQILLKLNDNTLLNSTKYKQKINKILSDFTKHYRTINSCHQSYTNKTVPDESKVPYISTIIDYIEVLFEPHFQRSSLLNGFQILDFFSLSYDFHKVRNDLSHPAASKITVEMSKEVIRLIEKILLNIDDTFFWYSSKTQIRGLVDIFLTSIVSLPIKINNLSEIAYTHKRLIQRGSELAVLKELIFGNKEFQYYRKARSVVVYGYGGLGKTALILEFINEVLKESLDTNNSQNLDFLLFFTAKEEELKFSETQKDLQITEIKKQVTSFKNFTENLFKYLNINDISEIATFHGIIIIDNIETLKNDKEKIIEFIRTLPDSIQVIITSREEEIADNKIQLKGYENSEIGSKFITEYIDEYNLNIEFKAEYEKLISASKGNTLILVLSLLRLNENENSFTQIINELNSTTSASISTVANFMYKNTFDQAIEEIDKKGVSSKKILSVIAYFNEPIDLYSLAILCDIKSISDIEAICDILVQKLVLARKNETYEINDFASKFIIVKIIPNKIEAQFLTNKISTFKFERRKILRSLEDNRTNDKLNKIMLDWAPRNNIEKIAIAEAYNLFSIANKYVNSKSVEGISFINKRFNEIESYSQHPYVKFQKARVISHLLKRSFNNEFLQIINKSYEDAIFTIKFDYQYIANTQSFAAVLWFYAIFLIKNFEDYFVAARNLEEANEVCEKLNIKNDVYNKIIYDLTTCYNELFKITRDRSYITLRDSLRTNRKWV